MVFRPRDEWTDFVRQQAAGLRGRFVRRFWGPTVRRRVRAAMWLALGGLVAAWIGCTGAALWYSLRAHHLSGVPVKHRPVRWEGQPSYQPLGAGAEDRPRVPITEEQFRAWDENQDESRRWGRRSAALLFPTAALFVLLALRAKLTAPAPVGSSPG
jgi:hypothetical protein